MNLDPVEIEALQRLYQQSTTYNRRFGGPEGGLRWNGRDGIAAQMQALSLSEGWPTPRQYTGQNVYQYVTNNQGLFGPPRYLMPPHTGPSGYLRPNFNFWISAVV